MEAIIDLHHSIFYYLLVILLNILLWGIISLKSGIINKNISFSNKNGFFLHKTLVSQSKKKSAKELGSFLPIKYSHDSALECFWTFCPMLILFFIAVPSFLLLYQLDEVKDNCVCSLKVIGNQWFWSYEIFNLTIPQNLIYLEKDIFKIESYMLEDKDLFKGRFRLLEVDKKLLLPVNVNLEILISSNDVLHSWCIKAFGIKVDACPGRLNRIFLNIKRPGIYYGQCSEICGIKHGFMPIVVCAVYYDDFLISLI